METEFRPTLSKIIEAVFSYLSIFIHDAEILDAFAGSGRFGIKALKNEASFVTFVEYNKKYYHDLKKDLNKLFESRKFEVVKNDFFKTSFSKQYDLIFLDPPYGKYVLNDCINYILDKEIIKENGVIVYEHSSKEKIKLINSDLEIWDNKKYGDTSVLYLYYPYQ